MIWINTNVWGFSNKERKRESVVQFAIGSNSKDTIDFASIVKGNTELVEASINRDTLKIVSENRSFFYPFGRYKSISLIRSHNPLFNIIIEKAKLPNRSFTNIYKLIYKNSFVKLIKDPDLEGLGVVSGKIKDKGLKLQNGVEVGMTKSAFLNLYFNDSAPQFEKIKVVEIISGAAGIWHYYYFKDDVLSSIAFDSDYVLDGI
ncbi:hypothetical protein DDR33_24295 [Pararcticibacter amylolyticus]|uniref:Uncharacterized protein n=2 Tax=Pararcticibacter amylolyticus TaxID=2173175 RepID=A0A2U2P9I0_9SPHI|nr:hypothetical protein DDR33_24295 [Pararcticibacter amylolyticus]